MSFQDEFLEYARHMPEVPDLYNRWAGVMAVSVTLGKSFWMKRGIFNVYPNFYVMLIGSPGTGKGTVCNILQRVLESSDFTKFAADKSSKEKFIQDLADGFDFKKLDTDDSFESLNFEDVATQPSECFILAEEFNDFIGTNNIEFVALLTKLWSYSGIYRNRLKTGRSVEIFDPCINLFGGNTHSGFTMAFPPEVVGQGFLARMLLVYGEGTGKKVSFPKPPDDKLLVSLGRRLVEIKYKMKGEASVSEEVTTLLDEINQTWVGFKDDLRFQHYASRRFTQLLKLCVVFCASRGATEIIKEDVIEANTLLTDTEDVMQKALGEFGKAKHADVNSKVMQAIHEAFATHGKGINTQTLWKFVMNDLDSIGDLTKILQNLSQAERVLYIKDKGWFPKNELRKRNEQHTKH